MKYLIIILFVMVILACEEDSNPANNKTEYSEYFPLEIGNWWIYEHNRINNRFQKIETTALKTINNKLYTEFSDSYLDSNENVISINSSKYYRYENNKVFILEDIEGDECKMFDFDLEWPDSSGYLDRDFFVDIVLKDSSFCFDSGLGIKGIKFSETVLNNEIEVLAMASYSNQPNWILGKNIGIYSHTSIYPYNKKLVKTNLIGE